MGKDFPFTPFMLMMVKCKFFIFIFFYGVNELKRPAQKRNRWCEDKHWIKTNATVSFLCTSNDFFFAFENTLRRIHMCMPLRSMMTERERNDLLKMHFFFLVFLALFLTRVICIFDELKRIKFNLNWLFQPKRELFE